MALLATALGLQNFRHFVGGSGGGVPLEVARNGENGVAHAHLGHAVRAAGGGLLAGVLVIDTPFHEEVPAGIIDWSKADIIAV